LAINVTNETDLTTISEPVRIMVSLRRGIRTDPTPTVSSLILYYSPTSSTVAFIHDVKLEALHDDQFRNSLFNGDGSPSEKLKNYVKELNDLVPIMWGKWKWDESYWDFIDQNLMGLHVLPNIWDPRLSEISNTYFQIGVGSQNDLEVLFSDDCWTPQIHNGYYYNTRKETIVADGTAIIETTYDRPEFVSIVDTSGRSYSVVDSDRNELTIRPVAAEGTILTVFYGAEHYLYTKPKTMTIAGPVSELLIDVPKQEAPVIIDATTGNERVNLKQVAFLDKDGNLSIRNSEIIYGNNSTDIYLTYGPAIDVNVHGKNVTGVNNNVVSLDSVLSASEYVEVDYIVANSFMLQFTTEGKALLTFPGEYENLSVTYEEEEETAYYQASGPSFDPMYSHFNAGFLYITQDLYEAATLDVSVFPDVIRGDGYDYALIMVDVLDCLENPVLNQQITATIEQVVDENGNVLESLGQLSQIDSYYNRVAFRYTGPVLPMRTADPSSWIPSKASDTDWTQYRQSAEAKLSFVCAGIKETVNIKVR
jgi:hypothetical protein